MSVIISLLSKAGVDFRYYGDGSELQICCPFCTRNGRESSDTHYCLGINRFKYVAHCLRCDWAANGLTSLCKQLSREFGVTFSYREMLQDMQTDHPLPKRQPKETGLPEGFERFHPRPLDYHERMARRYLHKRGIGKLEIAEYRVGYAVAGEMAGRVIFPVLGEELKIYGYVGRAYLDGIKPKYLNSKGIKILWNAQRKGDTAVVVEGLMDAIAVSRALRDQGVVGVATLGCGIGDYQLEQLRRFRRVVSFPDWNEVGIKEAIQLCSRASDSGLQAFLAVPRVLDGSDPDAWPTGQLCAMYGDIIPWSKAAEWKLRRIRRAVDDDI